MDPSRFMVTPATIHRTRATGDVDDYGDQVSDAVDVAATCWLRQTRADEDLAGADTQLDTWEVFFPAGTDIAGTDTFTVDGDRYSLTGPPWVAKHPVTLSPVYVRARARRVDPAVPAIPEVTP